MKVESNHVLIVYIHELCHTFGGDKSENFSYAMTEALKIVMSEIDCIEKYKKIWSMVTVTNFCGKICG